MQEFQGITLLAFMVSEGGRVPLSGVLAQSRIPVTDFTVVASIFVRMIVVATNRGRVKNSQGPWPELPLLDMLEEEEGAAEKSKACGLGTLVKNNC